MNKPYDTQTLLVHLGQKFEVEIDPKVEEGLVLVIDQSYKIQIEFLDDRIILTSILGELLPSRYRFQVFQDVLKANFKSTCFGSLGYHDRTKMLILILSYPTDPLIEEDFFTLLEGFIHKAKEWKQALISSNTRLLV
jgi:hypothetical protein